MTVWDDLAAEFPQAAISWRAQSVTKSGDKAMALAYIDARDVMNRLDDVLGPENWKDRYEFNAATAICYLSIRVDSEWIEKADGAGSTDVEAEKGQISDALKRAAVKWKIGRYLYDMPSPWVPCESYEKNGKRYWSKWTADPWDFVRGVKPTPSKAPTKAIETPKTFVECLSSITSAMTIEDLGEAWATINANKAAIGAGAMVELLSAKNQRKAELIAPSNNFDAIERGEVQ